MLHLILIVEDDPLMLAVLAGLFSDEGYRVRCAEDGQEAIDSVAAEVPAAMVGDGSVASSCGHAVGRAALLMRCASQT